MKPADVRAHLLSALGADLIGPFQLGAPGTTFAEAHAQPEILPLPPSRWYFTGFLAPEHQRDPDKDDLDSHGGEFAAGSESQAEDAGTVEPEPARPIRFPASMGLSVYLPPPNGAESIDVELSYADYEPIDIAEDTESHSSTGWERKPWGPKRFPVRAIASLCPHGDA